MNINGKNSHAFSENGFSEGKESNAHGTEAPVTKPVVLQCMFSMKLFQGACAAPDWSFGEMTTKDYRKQWQDTINVRFCHHRCVISAPFFSQTPAPLGIYQYMEPGALISEKAFVPLQKLKVFVS